jgi:hypothetical protein
LDVFSDVYIVRLGHVTPEFYSKRTFGVLEETGLTNVMPLSRYQKRQSSVKTRRPLKRPVIAMPVPNERRHS